jgi:hypothetical protein
VPLHPGVARRSEIPIEIVRHTARRPAVITPKPLSIQQLAHHTSDPLRRQTIRTAESETWEGWPRLRTQE